MPVSPLSGSGSNLDEAEDLLLDDLWWVVLRSDDLNEFAQKVLCGHLNVEPLTTVLHTRLQHLEQRSKHTCRWV